MSRLAIVGSRGYQHLQLVAAFVSGLRPSTVVVSGGARGVDRAAEQAARSLGRAVDVLPAEWQRHGRSAGYRRNEQLVASVDGLVAFWDGASRGTAHSIRLARQRGIWLRVYGPRGAILPESELPGSDEQPAK